MYLYFNALCMTKYKKVSNFLLNYSYIMVLFNYQLYVILGFMISLCISYISIH